MLGFLSKKRLSAAANIMVLHKVQKHIFFNIEYCVGVITEHCI